MRPLLIARLAWQDYRQDARLSACAVLALVAVIAPLLVLFGLKFGLIGSLTERLQRDPGVREIIALGGGRFNAEFIARLAARPDVAFAIPRTRQIAATAELLLPAQGRGVTVEMLPTAANDPLLDGAVAPNAADLRDVVLSYTAAEKLGARAGDRLLASFSRRQGGEVQWRQTPLHVRAVLPLASFERDGLFASLALLEAAEDYRDGRAVPALGWDGDSAAPAARVYPAFRLYARTLDDVEPLRRFFAERKLLVSTQAAQIAQVQSLGRNLDLVFWIIASLAVAGAAAAIAAGAVAAVERKQRELAVLRLLGLGTAALLLFVVLQALYSGLLAAALAALLYLLAEQGLNRVFMQVPGEYAAQLLPVHYVVALLSVLLASTTAAALGGWRVARIDASQGIRDV
ncbi:ABC transporter permease [Pseudomonas sp. S75]|uniref:FtsX-like permease family protein n=1 Tax=unclassified Pseudomonas TaxID=196821 RepID=UPI001905E7CE|nr:MULTISPECIES: FtsX-like permease family protein [unclassified Pseudomonas]MBJ9977398.1 ABC transporter permease [Pseudomonas sp. S30]MBK0154790.1 ABC transporter permease [Pseudomonas sp. S75]